MSDNLQIISKLYHTPEFSRTFICSPRVAELCTQTFLRLHAEAAVI